MLRVKIMYLTALNLPLARLLDIFLYSYNLLRIVFVNIHGSLVNTFTGPSYLRFVIYRSPFDIVDRFTVLTFNSRT